MKQRNADLSSGTNFQNGRARQAHPTWGLLAELFSWRTKHHLIPLLGNCRFPWKCPRAKFLLDAHFPSLTREGDSGSQFPNISILNKSLAVSPNYSLVLQYALIPVHLILGCRTKGLKQCFLPTHHLLSCFGGKITSTRILRSWDVIMWMTKILYFSFYLKKKNKQTMTSL